jgi:two-component system NtrC family sensor kinase
LERLLVIDDSKEARDFLEEFLGNRGYSVLAARDGEEGLHRALNEVPDLILVDQQMPDMKGLEVISALNEAEQDIPIILMTAYGSEQLVVQAFRLGACDYVPKPYEPDVLLDAIERAMREVRLRKERDQLTQELVQANEKLQRQLQELNALYTIGKSVTSLLDLEQVLSRIVEAALYMTGAEEGSLLLLDEPSGELYLRAAKNLDEKVARGLRLRVEDSLAGRVVNTGKPVMLDDQGLKKIKTAYLVKSLLMVPLKMSEQGVVGVLVVDNKVSEQSFSERDVHLLSALADYAAIAIHNAALVTQLNAETEKLTTILRETDDVVLVLDQHKQILLCNPAARDAFELGEQDVVGCPLSDVISKQELLDLVAETGDTDVSQYAEVSLSDGRTLNASLSVVSDVGYVLVMQDITHLKELDRVKSEFVSTVSHDLRTPLTKIQSYVQLLPRVGPVNEEQKEFIARLQHGMSAITDLVSDLLDIGRIEAGFELEMSQVDLKPIVSEAVAEFRPIAEAKHQQLQFQVPPGLPMIRGNSRRLRQVLNNLIDNALNYTPDGGQIEISVAELEEQVLIRVMDDGVGIPVEDQPYVFDKFFLVETPEHLNVRGARGTGLGLSIVKSVVEKHGGRVWVESAPGEGSTFSLLLPKQ